MNSPYRIRPALKKEVKQFLKSEQLLSPEREKRKRQVPGATPLAGTKFYCLVQNDSPEAIIVAEDSILSRSGLRLVLFPRTTTDAESILEVFRYFFDKQAEREQIEICLPYDLIKEDTLAQLKNTRVVPAAWTPGSKSIAKNALLIRLGRFDLSRNFHGLIAAPTYYIHVEVDSRTEELIKTDFLIPGTRPLGSTLCQFCDASGLSDQNGQIQLKAQSFIGFGEKPAIWAEVQKQFSDYFAGKREQFTLPYRLDVGTEFQRMVWQGLSTIPYGHTLSYEDLAARILPAEENPRRYARAVGAACGANPLCIILPCHRVIGQKGQLIGFAGGVSTKAALLDLELWNQDQGSKDMLRKEDKE